ncbi:MAG: precorrin-6A/cobalt-precorrin-6A reductase [Cyanobium sp. M30B3]|nr:MAG: precorrin-6A/cobalt-precorrin-6A reductase [Cyanobium sp. M30B3]
MAAILMHCGPGDHHPARRLWLFSGTGDGPPLARAVLEQGWQLRVSVVTADAARAYPAHPRLELQVGALGGSEPLQRALEAAGLEGRPFRAVIDAAHPFAEAIHRQLEQGCGRAGVPLLRLVRAGTAGREPPGGVHWLEQLADLAAADLAGRRLLLAIGARQLAEAVAVTAGALHHARVLPRPGALQQALRAGVAAERLACLQPLAQADAVEAALVRRWRIEAIVARQSGPPTETLWRRVAESQGCRLLLLRQPPPGRARSTAPRTGTLAELERLLAAWSVASPA